MPSYSSRTKVGSSPPMSGRTTDAPPRSYSSGCGSCANTVTSWPARLHSRASARVYTLDPVPPSRYPCQSRMRISASSPAALREVEVERVEQVDRGVRRVHRDVRRDVEERLGIVEDDLHSRADEILGRLLRARCRHREDADDDVLVADEVAELAVVAHADFPDGPPHLLRV